MVACENGIGLLAPPPAIEGLRGPAWLAVLYRPVFGISSMRLLCGQFENASLWQRCDDDSSRDGTPLCLSLRNEQPAPWGSGG